jgi:hypothetical protein
MTLRTLRSLRVNQFARIALAFWACIGVVAVAAVTALWLLLSASGSLAKFERFVSDVTGVEHFEIQSASILGSVALLIGVAVVVAALLCTCGVVLYNALTALVGGIEFTVVEPADAPAQTFSDPLGGARDGRGLPR